MDLLDCVEAAPFRAIAIGAGIKIRFEDRLQYQLGRGLHPPVPYRWDAERTLTVTPGLWDHHPPHRRWFVRLLDQVLPDVGQPVLEPCRLNHRKAHPVYAWGALVRAHQLIGVA
jgi:hypothetical protein